METAARMETVSSSRMSTKCFSLPFHPFCFLYYVAFTMFQVPFLSAFTFYPSPYNNPMRQKQYSHLTDEENETCKLVGGETEIQMQAA